MLRDVDIIDDWTAIKKALKQVEKHDVKKKKDSKWLVPTPVVCMIYEK